MTRSKAKAKPRPRTNTPAPAPAAFTTVAATAVSNCPGKHGLQRFITPAQGWWCSICKQEFPADEVFYGCRECDYDECMDCALTPPSARPIRAFVPEMAAAPTAPTSRTTVDEAPPGRVTKKAKATETTVAAAAEGTASNKKRLRPTAQRRTKPVTEAASSSHQPVVIVDEEDDDDDDSESEDSTEGTDSDEEEVAPPGADADAGAQVSQEDDEAHQRAVMQQRRDELFEAQRAAFARRFEQRKRQLAQMAVAKAQATAAPEEDVTVVTTTPLPKAAPANVSPKAKSEGRRTAGSRYMCLVGCVDATSNEVATDSHCSRLLRSYHEQELQWRQGDNFVAANGGVVAISNPCRMQVYSKLRQQWIGYSVQAAGCKHFCACLGLCLQWLGTCSLLTLATQRTLAPGHYRLGICIHACV